MKLRWELGFVAAFFLAIFCLYPQFKMLYLRGDAWNGHYAYNDIDEVAYASYVRALIDGRPRKNDPYTGRDESPGSPQPESLFSIQFAAPYTAALPARLFGIGAPWAMTISGAVAGFLAAFAAFWLVGMMTGNSWYAMASSLVVFAGGALAAGEGALPEILFEGFSYPYFPGFRRYIPAMAMPAVFALFAVVWKIVSVGPGSYDAGSSAKSNRRTLAILLLASFLFAYTVFSYFYTWTTAAAWLGCLFVLLAIFRPSGWAGDIKKLTAVGGGCLLALVPYAYLLSKRTDTMDHVQLLVSTRTPDLARVPVYIGITCLVLIIAGAASKMIELRERSVLFAMSFSLVPLIVFNQQIITGRSLQPIHYQVFIGNYVAALALMTTIGVLFKDALGEGKFAVRLTSVFIAAAAATWGFVECHYTVRVLDEANIERDMALPVARRLEELASNAPHPHRSTVLAFDMIQADDLPSVAPQNVLWARHQHVFAGLSWQESKERYYQYLYFNNVDEEGLDRLLKRDFVSQIALFGWGRHTDRLSHDARPLTFGEIEEEVANYRTFRNSFTGSNGTVLSYVVVNDEAATDLSAVEAWYELYDGQTVGKYTIFRARLRG